MKNNKPIILKQQITDTLEENYMPYAMSVIVSRAIPEIDGLKPSHRKLLYTMHKMGLLSGGLTKSANIVGQTMRLNPHGDAAIYETLVRLTDGNGALLLPLVKSKGNFGRVYSRDMAYAAARYTEAKLNPICAELFGEIDKNTVDFTDNYDGTMQEPTLLPTTFPNILANPNQGIAVGMASNICCFNLRELCDATIEVMKNPEADLSEIMPAPDFPTGGQLLYSKSEIDEIYRTGRGSVKVRAKYKYDKKQNCIDIYEIPYSTTVEVIIDKIVDLVKSGKVREISDIRDETDLSGLKITIDLKRGADPDQLMAKLYKMTSLQDSFGCNFNILVEGSPMVLGVNDILCEWLRFRRSCVKRALSFDIEKKSDKLHLLEGLALILLDIDKAIKIVRETEDDAMVIPNLMKGFNITKAQAEFVAEIKLRNLNKDYILKRTAEIENLKNELEELRKTVESKRRINKLIEKQLKQVAKKYGSDRKTEIISADAAIIPSEEETIPDYSVKLFRTRDGYLKKISLVSLRTSGEQRVKEGDELIQEVEAKNSSEVIFFAEGGTAYKMKAYDIPDSKASLLGDFIPNLLGLTEKEAILGMAVTDDFKGELLFCFENGKAAKVPLAAYQTKTNRKKLTGAFSAKSPLAAMFFIPEGEKRDIVLFSDKDRAVAFSAEKIPLKSTRSTQGVNVMTSRKGSKVARGTYAEDSGLVNVSRFRTKTLPAVGAAVRDVDLGIEQISMD